MEKIIQDWFDVKNSRHLEALDYFLTRHRWPGGFLPKNIKVVKGSVNTLSHMVVQTLLKERNSL